MQLGGEVCFGLKQLLFLPFMKQSVENLSCVFMPSDRIALIAYQACSQLTLFVFSVVGGTRLQNRPPGVCVHRGGAGIHLSGHPEAGWKLRTKYTAL